MTKQDTTSPKPTPRVKTPTLLQMEAVECGAAALGIVLAHYGRIVPLEQLRVECGVTRDGSKASNVVKAARKYGLEAKGLRKEPDALLALTMPVIVFWNFNHFLVVEGRKGDKVYINDPKSGPRVVSYDEFDMSYTGIVLSFELTDDFEKGGEKHNVFASLRNRMRHSEVGLLFVVLASLLLVVPGLVVPTFTRVFVDDILVRDQPIITELLIAMAVVAVVMGFLTYLQQTFLLRLETKLSLSMSSKFFWHLFRLPIDFFTQRFAGDIASRVEANDNVAKLISGDIATSLLGLILVVFYAGLMVQYDIILTVLGVAIALVNLVALQYFARRRKDANQKLLQEEGQLIGTAMSGMQIIETLKATGSESDFFSRWSGYHAKTINAEQKLGLTSQLLTVIPPFLTALNTTAILIIGSLRVIEGALTIGMLVAFQALMTRFLLPVTDMVNLGSRLQEVQGDLTRLDDILRNSKDERVDRVLDSETEFASTKLAGYVELKGVTFGYSQLSPPLIEDFNLEIQPGEQIALVGGSGSGKSTVAKIIAGLYEPWEGEVLLDGHHRDNVPRTTLANSLAMVDQDIVMFEGTIHENITLWDETIPRSRVVQATKDAQIADDVAKRPGAYDHQVEEGGRNFSGGQRQRLEIARALVKNPTILVLDEATSALDPVTEKYIADNLRKRGTSTIIVAHRLSTIMEADEIIVMQKGKIVQRGTHDELYKQEGPYHDLVRSDGAGEAKSEEIELKKIFARLRETTQMKSVSVDDDE